MSAWTALRQHLARTWQQRPARERRWLALGAIVLLAALVWSLLLAPAWRVWREAPARQARLEQQTRHMQQLQAEARQLQAPRRIERAQALQLLTSSGQRLLGPGALLQAQGEELRVTLKAAPAAGLAEWLTLAREQAQARPRLAQLEKQLPAETPPPRPAQQPDSPSSASWSGTLVLSLP